MYSKNEGKRVDINWFLTNGRRMDEELFIRVNGKLDEVVRDFIETKKYHNICDWGKSKLS